MGNWVSKDMVQKAMQVDLLSYAQSLGMEFETRGSRDVFYLKGHSLNISKSKNLYNQYSTGEGGNVIQFAQRVNGWSFQEAVRSLCGEDIQKNYQVNTNKSATMKTAIPKKEKIILPKAHTDSRRTFAYLVKTRNIDPEIISSLMKENKIYENDKHSCVFVGYDEKGEPGYASVRSTYTMGNAYKGDVKNSDKSVCFSLKGNSDIVYVFEAPIDAMSHAALTKVCGGDWRQDWRISLGGVSDGALARFLKQHPEIKNISFCLDNDLAGNKVLKNEYNNDGSLKKAGYMKKYKDMGYNVFRDEPMNKDFNEDLQMTVEGFKKMEQEQAVPEIEEDMCL